MIAETPLTLTHRVAETRKLLEADNERLGGVHGDLDAPAFRGCTLPELRAAFDAVATPGDWRAPINTFLPDWLEEGDPGHHLTAAAIAFYTATEARFTTTPSGRTRVEAIGYRWGPAGDH